MIHIIWSRNHPDRASYTFCGIKWEAGSIPYEDDSVHFPIPCELCRDMKPDCPLCLSVLENVKKSEV